MDVEGELADVQQQLLDAYNSVVIYFDSLGTYGLVGWVLVALGVVLAFAGAVLLAL